MALFKKISIKDKFIEMKINILLKLNRSNAAKQECSRIISLSQRAFIHADILKKDIEFQKLTEEAGTCKFTDKFLSVLDNYSLAYQHAENKEQKIAAFQALNNLYTTVSSAANSAIVMKTLFATAMAIPIYNEKEYNFELIRQFKHIKYLFDAHIALSKATIGNEPILNYCAIKTDLKQLEKVLSLSTLLQYLKNEILLSPDRKSTAKMSDFDLKNQYLRYFRFYLQQMDHQKFARIIKEFDRIVDAANPEVGCILAMDAAIAELTAAKANNSSQFTRLVSSAKAEFDVMAETAISTLKALVLQRKQDYAAQLGNDVDSKKNSKP